MARRAAAATPAASCAVPFSSRRGDHSNDYGTARHVGHTRGEEGARKVHARAHELSAPRLPTRLSTLACTGSRPRQLHPHANTRTRANLRALQTDVETPPAT